MDIGTLTGEINLEDKVSDTLTLIGTRIKKFADEFEGALGVAALAAGAVVVAIGTVAGAILALGDKGSVLLGVEAAFDRLAEAAGSTGEQLSGALNEGLKGTIDGMAQMQSVMRPLTAGVKLTGDDMKVMGEAARAMGKATGTDARNGLEALSSALTTGRTRGLALQGIVVDVTKAEKDFAKSLGITKDELNEEGKLQAHRIAILQATKEYVDRLGVSQLSLKERMQQAQVAFGNWFDELSRQIASSPNIMRAWDSISDAFQRAFGGDSQKILEKIVSWVNKFADAAAYYGPKVISWLGQIRDWVYKIWQTVTDAWELVPDWFKNIAKEAALAGGTVYLLSKAIQGLGGTGGGGGLLSTVASFATITSGLRDFYAVASASLPSIIGWFKNLVVSGALVYQLGGVAGILDAIAASLGAFLTGTTGGVALLIAGVGFAAYRTAGFIGDLYSRWKESKPMWDAFRQGGSFWDNSIIGRALGMSKEIEKSALTSHNLLLGQVGLVKSPGSPGMTPGKVPNYVDDHAKEILEATQASYKRMADLSGEYFALQDKMDGEHLENQFNALDETYRKEKAVLDETFKYNKNYMAELTQLTDTYLQKRLAAEVEYKNKSIETSRAVGLAAQDAIGKGLLGMPDVLRNLAEGTAQFKEEWIALPVPIKNVDTGLFEMGRTMQTLVSGSLLVSNAIKGLNENTALIPTQSERAEAAIAAAMTKAAQAHLPLTDEQNALIARLKRIGLTSQQIADIMEIDVDRIASKWQRFHTMLDEVANSLTLLAQSTDGSFSEVTKQITNIIVSWNTAAKAADNYRNATTLAGKAVAIAQGVAAVAQATGSGSRGSRIAGGALSGMEIGAAVAGPWGAAAGAAIGGIIGLVRSFGASAIEKEGRDIVAQFEQAQGGWQGIQKALLATGMSADDVNQKIQDMWAAEKQGGDAAKASIASITKALDDFAKKTADTESAVNDVISAGQEFGHKLPANIKLSIKALMEMKGITDDEKKALNDLLNIGPSFQDVQDRAEKFGISLAALGPKFQQANIESRSKDITDLLTDITDLGGDVGGALDGLKDEISGLVNDSLDFKVAIPENMKPFIQELIRAGSLTDVNGDKITDITKLTFENTPLDTSLDKLTKAIDHLSDILSGVPSKIDKIGDAANRLPTDPFGGWDVSTPEPPIKAAHGFRGRVSAPTLFEAGEGDSPEDVFIGPAGRNPGGSTVKYGDVSLTLVLAPNMDPNDQRAVARAMKKALRDNTEDVYVAVQNVAKRAVA